MKANNPWLHYKIAGAVVRAKKSDGGRFYDVIVEQTGIEVHVVDWAFESVATRIPDPLPERIRKALTVDFCLQCGAGTGASRREGEGTCPACDIDLWVKETLKNWRKKEWRDE